MVVSGLSSIAAAWGRNRKNVDFLTYSDEYKSNGIAFSFDTCNPVNAFGSNIIVSCCARVGRDLLRSLVDSPFGPADDCADTESVVLLLVLDGLPRVRTGDRLPLLFEGGGDERESAIEIHNAIDKIFNRCVKYEGMLFIRCKFYEYVLCCASVVRN